MKKKFSVKYLLLLIVAIFIAACVFLPAPYFIQRPGSTVPLAELVTVNGQEDDAPGSYSLTSVGVYQGTALRLLQAKFDPFSEIISEEEMFGGATSEEYNQMQEYFMTSSQNSAIEQALKLADKPYHFEFKGVYVMHIDPASDFIDKLAVGDTVVEVDGKQFESSQEFMDYVQNKKVGDTVTIKYLRNGSENKASGQLIELPSNQKAGIGISLIDHTAISSDEKIEFHVENIGGPSAGLMFTLQIYDQLVEADLRKGRKIAGTGTMNLDGTVGRIGGIDKKIASAAQEGTEIFFAPEDPITDEMKKDFPGIQSNYQEAKTALEKLDSNMKIVPVKTVKDAVDYLMNNP